MRWVVFLLILSTFPLSAALQYLTKTVVTETSFESVTNNFVSDYCVYCTYDDAVDRDVPIGFSFPFNGNTYTTVNIDTNGILYFGNYNLTEYNNQQLPRSNRDQSIYPYWDDLNMNSGGTIRYETLGNSSNRHFVVSWNNVPHYPNTGSYSFQVVFYEDGAIRFRYLSGSSANGASATIGVQEDSSPLYIDQHLYNSATLNQNQDILYIPNPINLTTIPPECATPIPKISLSTYDTTGYNSYPSNASQYQTLINNYAANANLFGSGYVDNITVSSASNNNPYGADSHYLALFKGYIYLPETGIYKFGIDGDDAVEVYIDDTLITGWYGGHGRANHAMHVKYVQATAGYHKIEYHMQERTGGDSYYLYWQPPSSSSIVIVPPSQFFHCKPSINKSSCIIDDPVNSTVNPKRIPGGTVRYAIEIDNTHFDAVRMNNSLTTDDLNVNFDTASISNLRIANGACNCQNPGSTSANGANGGVSGSTVTLDFGTVNPNTKECGYFEVEIK